jgi:hypothetical protein
MANESKKSYWFLERLKEPSTYQGLSMLAGVVGQWVLGSSEAGQQVFQAALAVAACIQVGKAEAVKGRDY